jgi:hypothetical protein
MTKNGGLKTKDENCNSFSFYAKKIRYSENFDKGHIFLNFVRASLFSNARRLKHVAALLQIFTSSLLSSPLSIL